MSVMKFLGFFNEVPSINVLGSEKCDSTINPQMRDPQSTSTHPVSPVVEESTINLEPIPILGAVYRLQPSNSSLLRDVPTGKRLNATDPKPSPFLTPPPHIEIQGEIEAPSSEDHIPLATEHMLRGRESTAQYSTILLGENRSEKVMKGEERRWQKVVEIISDLWN
ncbi:hypothetical protein EYC80_000989 [Monilinia laxa]|uniref:Uncharacterized protein n=1 Tax=Monilinia laxa TaxID=61186 RepID=A0A5N6K7N9_MONLA|nr:hypothetical protein EYC80_000989 [Monilinia laxa]